MYTRGFPVWAIRPPPAGTVYTATGRGCTRLVLMVSVAAGGDSSASVSGCANQSPGLYNAPHRSQRPGGL
jgi:hypothetical protein